jgi:hypothetical protein
MTLNANLPPLVLAQSLYGDATREPKLTARNDPRNPLSMLTTLEALAQ